MTSDPSALPPLTMVEDGPAAVDTGQADRAEVAALVARARIDGGSTVRTAHPQAARRAAAVIDAIVAARTSLDGQPEGPS